MGVHPPADEFHGEDARRHVAVDGLRHHDQLEVREIRAKGGEVARLERIVQLAGQALAEFLDHFGEDEALAEVGVLVEHAGDLEEDFEVLTDSVARSRPLHLHRHLTPAAQLRAVHLPQGGRCDRLLLEFAERLGEPDAEILRTICSTFWKGKGSTSSCRRASASQ